MRWVAAVFVFGLMWGCGSHPSSTATNSAAPKAPVDPWILTCVDPNVSTPALLWNGLIGVRIGRNGLGTPNSLLAIDEYQTVGEEKIIAMPNPIGGTWRIGDQGEEIDPAKGNNYRQKIDMRDGILVTAWSQTVDGNVVGIETETAIDPNRRVLAQKWTFSAETYESCDLRDVPSGISSLGEMGSFEWPPSNRKVRFHYHASDDIRHAIPGTDMAAPISTSDSGLLVSGAMDTGRPFTFERVVNLSESPNASMMRSSAGIFERIRPAVDRLALRFAEVEAASRETWRNRWKTDIEIDGPVEDQQAVRSFLFYLRSGISPYGEMAISPFGLSDTTYFGHVFWDADVWVFPALALVDPTEATVIPNYRLARLKAAERNFEGWIDGGRETGGKPLGPLPAVRGTVEGLKYPWESSVSGNETVPGPSKFEDHITGDVVFSLYEATQLGMIDEETFLKICGESKQFWSTRWDMRSDGQLEIKDTMSPDENHIGDNDLYTNLLATFTGYRGHWASYDAQWQIPASLKLPQDSKSFLTYDDDTLKGYKQAAAVLAIYPLQYPEAEKEAATMMDRFADKVSKNGPAMTDSVHSIIWSRIGQKDKAYDAWRNSWEPFTAHPLMLFSEKRSKDTCYFTTGAAGSLQSVLYGFLGFRLDYKKQDGAAWSLPLNGGSWLSIKPNLPSSWKSVKFKNFSVLGRRYSLTATASHVQVTQGD